MRSTAGNACFMSPLCRNITSPQLKQRGFNGGTQDVIPPIVIPGEPNASRMLCCSVPQFGERFSLDEETHFGLPPNVELESVFLPFQDVKGAYGEYSSFQEASFLMRTCELISRSPGMSTRASYVGEMEPVAVLKPHP